VAVHRLAGLDPDPAFGNAIFLDVAPFPVLEAHTNTAPQRVSVEPSAAGVDGKAVWDNVCHDVGFARAARIFPAFCCARW
jgi:hypothetical protein